MSSDLERLEQMTAEELVSEVRRLKREIGQLRDDVPESIKTDPNHEFWCVCDTGIRIVPETLNLLFKDFTQGDT